MHPFLLLDIMDYINNVSDGVFREETQHIDKKQCRWRARARARACAPCQDQIMRPAADGGGRSPRKGIRVGSCCAPRTSIGSGTN